MPFGRSILIQRIQKPFARRKPMAQLITTLGPKSADALGMILPHEHVFVDLRTWDQPGYAEGRGGRRHPADGPADPRRPGRRGDRAGGMQHGGVGRRADILKAVSEATGFPLVAPTGVYREPWIPPWVHEAEEDALRDWMQSELEGEIETAACRPAGSS
jgi:phosphotriesterase-related protein